MIIVPDSNILVRAITEDDPIEAAIAQRTLAEAARIVIPLVVLSEFCGVVRKIYKIGRAETADVIRVLMAADTVVVDAASAAAGLAMLEAGGDFADGAIAHSARALDAPVFVSFNRCAVQLLKAQGVDARLPA